MGSYKKKLFIVLLLFLLISFFACSSVNATTSYQNSDNYYVTNTEEFLKEEQEILANLFIKKFDSTATQTQKDTLLGYINGSNSTNYWYFLTYTRNSQGTRFINLYTLNYNIDFNSTSMQNGLIETTKSPFFDVNITYPVTGYNFNYNDVGTIRQFQVQVSNSNTVSISWYTNDIFLPTFLIYYNNETISNYANGIMPTSNGWAMLFSAINDNTDAVEDTTQAVNNLRNDFNAEESDDDYDFPTDNPTTDPTTSGIDNIFNMFYLRINSWNALGINVPIPFTGKSFTINPNITENIINGWTPTTNIATIFKTLLSGVWYYLLGRYIVKDVQHYVDGLQTGEILTKSDTNIKTEML